MLILFSFKLEKRSVITGMADVKLGVNVMNCWEIILISRNLKAQSILAPNS